MPKMVAYAFNLSTLETQNITKKILRGNGKIK